MYAGALCANRATSEPVAAGAESLGTAGPAIGPGPGPSWRLAARRGSYSAGPATRLQRCHFPIHLIWAGAKFPPRQARKCLEARHIRPALSRPSWDPPAPPATAGGFDPPGVLVCARLALAKRGSQRTSTLAAVVDDGCPRNRSPVPEAPLAYVASRSLLKPKSRLLYANRRRHCAGERSDGLERRTARRVGLSPSARLLG